MNRYNSGAIVLHRDQPECETFGNLYIDDMPLETKRGLARIRSVCEDPKYPETLVVFIIEPYEWQLEK